MVKIRKYKPQVGATTKQQTEFVQFRNNPQDFSAVTNALGRAGATAADVGLKLFSQEEENEARLYEEKKRKELKLYEQVQSNETDYLVRKLKLDRRNQLTEKINLGVGGGDGNPGLSKLIAEYTHNPDYRNNEVNFNNAATAWRDKIAAGIDDKVVRRNFILEFDQKINAGKINVSNGSFKTGLQQATNAYEDELKQLYYDYEYGNLVEQMNAENRLFGVFDDDGKTVKEGIHQEAFRTGIINARPEVAENATRQNLEFLRAKKAVANDPRAFLELTKSDPTSLDDNFPYPNLSAAQRADLEIKAQNAVKVLDNAQQTNLNKLIKDNQAALSDIVKMLDDGNMPEDGLSKLGTILSTAELLKDQDTIDKANDYIAMFGTYNTAMQFNPAELQDELNEVRAEINKLNMPVEEGTKAAGQVTSTTIPGVSRELILKEKAMTTVLNKMNTAINNDSLAWAAQTNLVQLDTIDWLNASDEEFQSWVSKRQGQNDLVRAKYQSVDNFLTKADQQMIMNIWQDPDTDNTTKIFLMKRLAMFGEDADNVFSEVLYKGEGKNEAVYFAHLAGLMNSRDFDLTTNDIAQSFLNGFNDKDNQSLLSQQMMFASEENGGKNSIVRKEFTNLVDGSFHQVDGRTLENIFQMAKIIYVDRARNIRDSRVDKDLFNSIVNELVGANTQFVDGKNVQYGGFGEYNNQTTLIPSWMNAEKFEKSIERAVMLYPDKILNGQIPEWKYGESSGEFKLGGNAKSIFNRDGDQPYLWAINDGVYAVSFNVPWDNTDPQYVGTSTGGNSGYFILDLNLIKDELITIQNAID